MKKWNSFVESFIEGEEKWEDLQKSLDTLDGKELEYFPIEAQKHLTKFRRVKFPWMVPMLMEYTRGAGGLKELLIEIPKEKEKKENGKKD